MTQKRDANGKFAKKKPKNPDCEPATKGYVKCVARNVIQHDGYQYYYNESGHWQGVLSGACSIILIFAWALAMDAKTEPIAAWVIGMSAILCAIMAIEAHCMPKIYAEEREHKSLEKYEPPCDPKRGCEEKE